MKNYIHHITFVVLSVSLSVLTFSVFFVESPKILAEAPSISATAKGPNQINLTWSQAASPGYGYIVEVQSGGDTRYSSWTEYKPIPNASGYSGDPSGTHIYNLPVNGVPTWVTESQYIDPQDNSATQFIVSGLKPNTTYNFRVRAYSGISSVSYSAYSNTSSATTNNYSVFYVSTSGSDSNDGSQGRPWKTLSYAASRLSCGQVLLVSGGSYAGDYINMTQNCTPTNKVVVEAMPGETPVISSPPGDSSGITINGSSIVIDGLSVRPSNAQYQVYVSGNKNVLFNIETQGGWGVHLVYANNSLVYRNYLHDAGSVSNGDGGFVLTLEASTNNIIWSNHLTRGAHDVSLCKGGCTNSKWLNNIMDGGWGMGFEAIEQSTGNLVEGNIIWHTQRILSFYKPGIEISSANNTVRRNQISGGASAAIEISALYGGDSVQNTFVYNNTFANNGSCLFGSNNDGGGLGDSAYSGVSYYNNICVGFSGTAMDVYRAIPNISNNVILSQSGDVNERNIIWKHGTPGSTEYPVSVAEANTRYSSAFSGNITNQVVFASESLGDFHVLSSGLSSYGAFPSMSFSVGTVLPETPITLPTILPTPTPTPIIVVTPTPTQVAVTPQPTQASSQTSSSGSSVSYYPQGQTQGTYLPPNTIDVSKATYTKYEAIPVTPYSASTSAAAIAAKNVKPIVLSRTLSFGMKGVDVSLLQAYLTATGYLEVGNITGYFGNLTRAAVKKYQCVNLSICSGNESTTGYGIVGRMTRAALAK